MEPADRTRLWTVLGLCAGLAAITWGVYFQVRGFAFVNFDDLPYITGNPTVLGGLSWKSAAWAFTTGAVANWHPVTWLSHLADVSLFGVNAGGHHLTSVVFHTANTLLLFLVLRSMTRDLWPSVFVAALFAVHPLHVESVAWVAERKDVLSMFFMLLVLAVYPRSLEDRRARAAALALYAVGLMSKPMLVSLPLLLLLLDRWPLRRDLPLWILVREKLPYCVLAGASCLVTFLVQRSGGAVISLERVPFPLRMGNALTAYTTYLGRMVWPRPLAAFYPFVVEDVHLGKSLLALGLLVAVTALALHLRRSRPYVLAGWLWYLLSLVPVIGLVQVGSQSMADRYTYLPLVGPFVILAWGARDLAAKFRIRPWLMALVGGGATLLLAAQAHLQAATWRDSITLFRHDLLVAPENLVARTNIGQALAKLGRYEEAVPEFEAAIKLNPLALQPRTLLGKALVQLGRREEAVQAMRELLAVKPEDAETVKNLAELFLDLGRLEEAVPCYRRYLALEPVRMAGKVDVVREHDRSQDVRMRLGLILRKLGRDTEAVPMFRAALAINPRNPTYLFNLGLSLAATGKDPEAAKCFRECLRLSPRQAAVQVQLGLALERMGDLPRAADAFRAALALQPGQTEAEVRLKALGARGRGGR